ncbi:hypothetical protein BT69DRAFT_1289773, partial [Atractiella rhizophila]
MMFYDRQDVDDAVSSSFSVISFDLRGSLQYTDSSSRLLSYLRRRSRHSSFSSTSHMSRTSFTVAGSGIPLLIQPPSSTLQLALLYIPLPLRLSSTVLFCSCTFTREGRCNRYAL